MKWNLTVLNDMIDDSIDSGIPLLRLSSDLIPFATKAKEGVDLVWQTVLAPEFEASKRKNYRKQFKNFNASRAIYPTKCLRYGYCRTRHCGFELLCHDN